MISYCLILFCVLLLLLLILNRLLKNDDLDKIPGPKGLFLVRNSFDFMTDSVSTFIYFVNNVRKFKDIFKIQVGNVTGVLIYSPEYVEALVNGSTYNRKGYLYWFLRPWLKDGLLVSYGAKWQHRRKILTPAFHFNTLRYFSTTLVKNCNRLVKQLEPETDKDQTGVFSFVSDFALNSICETAMGTSLEESNDFGYKYKNAIRELGTNFYRRVIKFWYHSDILFKHSNLARKQNELLHLIGSFRNTVLKRRRQNPCNIRIDDIMEENSDFTISGKNLALLDILLKAESEGKINEDGINEEVDTFMFEGHDTTANALQFTFMLLANYQDAQDKIVAELDQIYGSIDREPKMSDLSKMKYLECCIKESLRLYPPVYFISRTIDQPLKLNSYNCPAGTDVTILIFQLHRREDQFVEPLKFLPERFMVEPTWHHFAYIPFSAGPRNCIGQKFAMMEMKLAISSVLRKYRLLPVTKPEDMVFVTDMVLRIKDPIYIKFERRLEKNNST